ncbi:RidA family protein [Klebsiella pneumoniae]|nr:RidA family protein [Klebsiella pneumoniae]
MSLEAGAGAPLARYAAWRRAGDFIFLSGIIPVNPLTGTIVNGFQDVPELGAGAAGGDRSEFSTDAKQGPILAQSWYVLESIRRTVASAGGQMSDVIKLVQYFRNLDHFPYYSRVRKLFYPDQPPVSTVVQVSEMLPDATVLIEVEATVWLPPSFNSEAPR